MIDEIIYKEDAYHIIGMCMNVHNELGHGFSEIVYKDALKLEFLNNKVCFEREKEYLVYYKGILLEHKFFADYVLLNKIIIEVKCVKNLSDENISQAINYLKVSNNKLALLVNFGRDKLEYKRIVY